MAVTQDDQGGPARSTMAFPMPKQPVYLVRDAEVDYSKSTGAWPMYDDRNARERVVEHLDATIEATYPTPGPQSYGHDTEAIERQRAGLGLSDDPSGESDTDYAARPSTVPGKGFDGVDRGEVTSRTVLKADGDGIVQEPLVETAEEAHEKASSGVTVTDAPRTKAPAKDEAEKAVDGDKVTTKVVGKPATAKPATKTTATGK